MSSYSLTVDGVREDETREVVCPERLEVVQYSTLDRVVYLRWPSESGHAEMGSLPRALLDAEDPVPLAERCRSIGLTIARGMEVAIRHYLRQALRRFLKAVPT